MLMDADIYDDDRIKDDDFDFWCLMPLSAISWRPDLMVEEGGLPGGTTDHGQATGKLYHLRLRVECALFCN